MNNRIRKVLINFGVVAISSFLSIAFVSQTSRTANAKIIYEKNETNTSLSTVQIGSPVIRTERSRTELSNDPWRGSYVYYGAIGDYPIKFRVLAPSTEEYGTKSIFLDSDSVLFTRAFDKSGKKLWEMSELRSYLNNAFLNACFTDIESKSIASSQKSGGLQYPGNDSNPDLNLDFYHVFYQQSVGLKGDKVFVLDAADATNPYYGYTQLSGKYLNTVGKPSIESYTVTNRMKYGGNYWLRANCIINSQSVGLINHDGSFSADNASNISGVAPALNVDLNKVLFSSLVAGKSGMIGAEYKLTVKTDEIKITVPSNGKTYSDGDEIVVPYAVTGDKSSCVNKATIAILDKEYTEGNSNGATLKYYQPLEWTFKTDGSFKFEGEGKFTLPSSFNVDKWGEEYYVYVLAEDINDMYFTDYSSMPVSLKKPAKKQTVEPTKKPVTPVPTKKVSIPTKAAASPVPTKKTTNADKPTPTSKPATASKISLSLDKTETYVVCGKTLSLKATLKGSDAKLSWKSSDNKIASVDSKGNVITKMAGPVTITVSAAGKNAKCLVTVLYKDVTDSSKFWFEPTNYLTAKGVVKGYDNQTKFKPANDCTRAQMVTFIWRLVGEPAPKTTKCKFSDVKSSDYFYKACIWGNENGIVEGYKDGTFGPKIVCARKHAVTFLWRLAGKPDPKSKSNKFYDVKKTDYFYTATLWASEKGILAGYSDGTFRPNGDCLRRQMVTFLYKYDKYINGK